MNKAFTILIPFILICVSASVQAEADAETQPRTQLDMNESAGQRFQLVDDELNRLYKEKMAVIKTPTNKERFRDAQRVWITFRDKACLYEAGTRDESGSMWALGYFYCMERHTRKRIQDLEEYIKCPPEECQN